MKVEIGESLGYSFLRHVKQCWLVQTNWKASESWDEHKLLSDEKLEQEFSDMRQTFDPDGSVFGKTTSSSQLLKQSEIDVVGVGFGGDIYAVEVAFHENGLQYGSTQETQKRVLKKMLRTKLILDAYHPGKAKRHIYFASPKVNPTPQRSLEAIFDQLRQKYPSTDWRLLTNERFTKKLLARTLEKVGTAADTSELFVRSAKLLELGGLLEIGAGASSSRQETPISAPDTSGKELGRIQPLVRNLMQTILEDFPSLLTESDRSKLMERSYCRDQLGLGLGGFALLRHQGEGVEINGQARYWQRAYADRYLVTNNWGRQYHRHNAAALLRWVEELIRRNAGQPGIAELESCLAAFQNYTRTP